MKRYEDRTETVTRSVFVERRCDLCGAIAKSEYQWAGSHYAIDHTNIEIKVKQEDGQSFPEGAWGKKIEIDLCPTCFKDRLVPWLESQGAKIGPEDWGD